MKQLSLLKLKKYKRRKTARPIATRGANHVVLKSRFAVMRMHHLMIKSLIKEAERRFGVRIRAKAIMDTHLHLLVQTPTRTAFQNALRFLAGQIAFKIGRGSFWLQKTWSRVVKWGRDFTTVYDYILSNPVKAGIWDEVDFEGFD